MSVSTVLPQDVSVVGDQWAFRSFSMRLGQAVTLYTDDVWVGPIGLYDVSDQGHIISMFEDAGAHALSLLRRRVERSIFEIMGREASLAVWAYRCRMSDNECLDPEGDILWSICEAINDLCYRDRDFRAVFGPHASCDSDMIVVSIDQALCRVIRSFVDHIRPRLLAIAGDQIGCRIMDVIENACSPYAS